ncbi:hypothetical protein ACJMK2_005278, partial [Sinanodonta woodiana]
ISFGSRVAKNLAQEQNIFTRYKGYKKSQAFKRRRCEKRTYLYKLYEEFQERKTYKKGL